MNDFKHRMKNDWLNVFIVLQITIVLLKKLTQQFIYGNHAIIQSYKYNGMFVGGVGVLGCVILPKV